ncbi:uncharacterized protein BDR25DRAFT_300186 [Lindgomyces ingoldianus]|uniref:Uncharacterized protein n=1 Tax=Lindgomyces ingoldianus TaxID=673940 RepID=A0ACB6RF94_9PLEO|nr:uncharacterized protein BDR25DRAFT_300186 [Lindgomyces ingoldianus]KAF2477162.1 hypothetical protein BDR25DRAFT_300186 [Lindgomyces ingoldianus]
MAPPLQPIPLSALETEISRLANGKPRKPAAAISNVRDCPLKEMVQYKCNIYPPKPSEGAEGGKKKQNKAEPTIICEPVVRLFRQ